MHSFVYQIHTAPIPEEAYLSEDVIQERKSEVIDYADQLYGSEREEAISRLFSRLLETGMFAINDDFTATYIGGFDKALEAWANRIKSEAGAINAGNVLQYRGRANLRDATINPLDTACLFCTYYSDDSGSPEYSEELYQMIAGMEPGDKLYIGGVYDYHS